MKRPSLQQLLIEPAGELRTSRLIAYVLTIATIVAPFSAVPGDLRVLHTFGLAVDGLNSDGAYPRGGLVISGNTLYGTASGGGLGYGNVFELDLDSGAYEVLYSFSGLDGVAPCGALALYQNGIYGTTSSGVGTGASGCQ